MVQEPQQHMQKLLFAVRSESTSMSETSLSGDEGTSFLEENENADELPPEKDGDIEKGEDPPSQSEKKKASSLQFLGWTVVNTLATIGIVSMQTLL